jgi:aldose 1-epimerase
MRYTLESDVIAVSIITYGARIESMQVPDRRGIRQEVVLGFDSLQGYVGGREYTGAIVGRFANRIADGRFVLSGVAHRLPINAPPNSMHGGLCGFDRRVWRAVVEEGTLALTYESAAGEEGYPGRLVTTVRYRLAGNQLIIDYSARTSHATVINLTNHSYFNLTGDPARSILDHELTLFADHYLPVDATMIPSGEIRAAAGTAFDFTDAVPIGARIDGDGGQLRVAGGYDHTWVLNASAQPLARAAKVCEPTSGRTLEVLTSQPGVQFYSGNHLTGLEQGRGGICHGYRCALCLETQHYPDSPNQPQFPSTELRAGDEFRSTTVFAFSTREG